MNSFIVARWGALAKVLAAFVLATGLLAAGTSTALARSAEDGHRHHHAGENGRHHR
jgi:hypothetical protein